MKQMTCDVAVVGGGLVGASLACALAPLGLKIALLEAVPPRAAGQPSYDERALALSASSCHILRGMGLWDALQPHATPIRKIFISERNRPGQVVLEPVELGLECFGHVVEARAFGAAVMDHLEQLDTVDFMCPASFDGLEQGDEWVQVSYTLEGDKRSLRTRLLVGADGAESEVRKALGIEVERHDYHQTAVICNVSPDLPHQGQAFECFSASGPFALLPHANDRCGLVWSVDDDEAAGLLALPDGEFLQRARDLFGPRLGGWSKVGKRSAYPLRMVRAVNDVAPRALILGNAAHAIHPIGAQGFNLGLRDVAVLAEVLALDLARERGCDVGAAAVLRAYHDWRAPDQAGTASYADGLARVFANPSSLAKVARSMGLIAHALIPPLRRQLAVRAMGYRGRIPRLALGQSLVAGES